MLTDYFFIAEVLRPHGIKGEVKLKVYSDDIENLMQTKTLYYKQGGAYLPIAIENCKLHQGEVIMQLQNVQDRNKAETWRNKELYIARADASPLAEGEFYISDIIGFAVTDNTGKELGILQEVLSQYATNVYVVKCKQGSMLFPAIDKVFEKVDLQNAQIILKADVLSEIAIFEA